MVVCHFYLNITFILIFTLIKCFDVTAKGTTSGPYKASVVAVNDCEKPTRPYVSDPAISIKMEVTNTSNKVLLGCNISIVAEAPNIKFRMKGFIWENGKWSPTLIMNDIGCHGMLLHVISASIGLKYDRKKCVFLKGEYHFKNLDVNAMQHIWASKMEYGRMLWRSEIFTPTGTFFCFDFLTTTEPA